jgi:hypothetical protein
VDNGNGKATKIRRLAVLSLKSAHTDKELEKITENAEEVSRLLVETASYVRSGARTEIAVRIRKRNLNALSDDELLEKVKLIIELGRQNILHICPPESDEYLIGEILQGRGLI